MPKRTRSSGIFATPSGFSAGVTPAAAVGEKRPRFPGTTNTPTPVSSAPSKKIAPPPTPVSSAPSKKTVLAPQTSPATALLLFAQPRDDQDLHCLPDLKLIKNFLIDKKLVQGKNIDVRALAKDGRTRLEGVAKTEEESGSSAAAGAAGGGDGGEQKTSSSTKKVSSTTINASRPTKITTETGAKKPVLLPSDPLTRHLTGKRSKGVLVAPISTSLADTVRSSVSRGGSTHVFYSGHGERSGNLDQVIDTRRKESRGVPIVKLVRWIIEGAIAWMKNGPPSAPSVTSTPPPGNRTFLCRLYLLCCYSKYLGYAHLKRHLQKSRGPHNPLWRAVGEIPAGCAVRFDVFVACSEHERAQGCPIRGDRAFRLFQAENDTPSNFVGWCDQTPSNFSVVFTSDCVAFVMGRGAGPGRNGEKEEIHLVHAPAGGVVQEDSTSTGDYPTSDRRRIEGRRTELGRDRGQSEESFVGQSEEEIEETTDEEASSSSGSEEEEDEEESKKNSVFYSVSSPSSGEDGSSSPLLPQGSAGSGEQAPSGAAVTSSSTKCAPTLNTVIQSILSDPILPLGDWLAPGETEQSYPTHRILNDLLDEHGDFLKPFLGKSCPKVLTVHAPPKHRLVLPQDIVDESSDEDGTTRKQVEKAGSGGGGSSKRIRPPITVLSEDSRMVGFKWRSGLISEETVWYGRAGVGDDDYATYFRFDVSTKTLGRYAPHWPARQGPEQRVKILSAYIADGLGLPRAEVTELDYIHVTNGVHPELGGTSSSPAKHTRQWQKVMAALEDRLGLCFVKHWSADLLEDSASGRGGGPGPKGPPCFVFFRKRRNSTDPVAVLPFYGRCTRLSKNRGSSSAGAAGGPPLPAPGPHVPELDVVEALCSQDVLDKLRLNKTELGSVGTVVGQLVSCWLASRGFLVRGLRVVAGTTAGPQLRSFGFAEVK